MNELTTLESPLLFKIIIIGDAGVGKTCLLHQYTHCEFKNEYNVTIGVEFSSKIIPLDSNTTAKLQIWDTAGQESFRSIIKTFYKKASGVFLMYSIANRNSFEQLDRWFQEVKENCMPKTIFILVGNQTDLEDQRKVTYEEGVKYMKENGLALFFETSAKTGENIEKAFHETAKLIFLSFVNSEFMKGKALSNGDGRRDVRNIKSESGGSCC